SLLSLAFFQYHYGFIYSLTGAQHTLDLAQLDPEAAHLHLLIHAAQKFDIAVGPVSRQIARAIQPRSILSKRMRHKFLRRQLRSSQITTRQTVAADIEFSHYSRRHRLEVIIKQKHLRIADRVSNRHCSPWRKLSLDS